MDGKKLIPIFTQDNFDEVSLRLSKKELHQIFNDSLNGEIIKSGILDAIPFELDLRPPLLSKIRLYIFNLTHPPGGRSFEECKIQLIVPGQKKGELGGFDNSDERYVLLSGYDARLEVFVFWDADLYDKFPHSRNVQVKLETVCEALSGRLGEQVRVLKNAGPEIVLTAHRTMITTAIRRRWEISVLRAIGELP